MVHVVVVVALPIDSSGIWFVTENDEPPVIEALSAKMDPPKEEALPPLVSTYFPRTNADDSNLESPTMENAGTTFALL